MVLLWFHAWCFGTVMFHDVLQQWIVHPKVALEETALDDCKAAVLWDENWCRGLKVHSWVVADESCAGLGDSTVHFLKCAIPDADHRSLEWFGFEGPSKVI